MLQTTSDAAFAFNDASLAGQDAGLVLIVHFLFSIL
jgi:hypothetical protein